jgi:hypothetical protein
MTVSYCLKIANVELLYLRFGEIKEQADSGQNALIVKVNANPGMTGNWRGGCVPCFHS